MKTIKLNAIDSTNSFLKELAVNSTVDNFTIVVTDSQLKGRGQQGNSWVSEPCKNLMFSVFVRFEGLGVLEKKYLNFAVSLALFDALEDVSIPSVCIKWPNDILSGNKKICGILIENSLKGTEISSSVIGIGLNVNQTIFPDYLKKASSLKLITDKSYNLDKLLKQIILKFKARIALLNAKNFKTLEVDYLNVLYKKNIPTMFKDSEDVLFMGIIRGISNHGKLQIETEEEVILEFGIKEVSFL
ncbi:biotin--[acetyl-CoA-carboxylase] ligase [Polaribacter sp. ALD11]|uniref:biotin--[acetyl-CoA-carboxylase] ligase n=1 Tax=Polaribacter sp. ALD11 TaxID=2058137 RepID=UPI000C307140|nr:biotin--[acetyl-CoA-carboxylase] ligase [Polaribacter sp. ALD11]AUC85067.1 biotin--[acetyl-CoA-carboxylase] ligase [Polaribacter sp. ALD11]